MPRAGQQYCQGDGWNCCHLVTSCQGVDLEKPAVACQESECAGQCGDVKDIQSAQPVSIAEAFWQDVLARALSVSQL